MFIFEVVPLLDVQDSNIMLIFIETVPSNKSLGHLSMLKKETVGKKEEIYIQSRYTETERFFNAFI